MADFISFLNNPPKPKTFGVTLNDIKNLVFGDGTLQYTQTLNGGLSISINYNSIPKDKIQEIRSLYKKKNTLSFFGNTFQVVSYTETNQKVPVKNGFLYVYNASITLESLTYLNASKNVEVTPQNGKVSSQDIALKCNVQYIGNDFTVDNVFNKESFNFLELLNERLFQFQKFFIIENDAIKLIDLSLNPIQPDRHQVNPLEVDSPDLFRYREATVEDTSQQVDPLANAPVFSIPQQEINYIAEGDPNPHICPVVDWYDESGEEVSPSRIGPDHPPIFGTTIPSYINLKNMKHWGNAARLLHYNFDKNGITKTYKLTKKIGDTTIEEEELTYGFLFSCYRLAVNGGSPQDYWRLVKYQKTTYIYQPLKQPPLNSIIEAFDPETNRPVKAVVDSELLALIADNPPKYLTKIVTQGWRYARFEQESYDGNNHDIDGQPGAPSTIYWGYRYTGLLFPRQKQGTPPSGWKQWVQSNLDLYLWRKVFFEKETVYNLVPKDEIFQEKQELDVELLKIHISKLQNNNNLPIDDQGFVYLAYPNPNSVKVNYLILSETTTNKDIIWRRHPLALPYNLDSKLNYNSDSSVNLSGFSVPNFYNPTLPPYVVGESTKSVITRIIIPNKNTSLQYRNYFGETLINQAPPDVTINLPMGGYKARQSNIDIYLEREEITNLEVRDANFPKEVMEVVNREIQGIPPEASVLQTEFIQKPISEIPKPPNYLYTAKIVSEPLNVQNEIQGETITITESNIMIKDACDFLYKVRLLMEGPTYRLAYDGGEYKKYKPGALLMYDINNIWVIKESRLNLSFNGKIITAESIELDLGEWYSIDSQIKLVQNTSNTSNQNTGAINPITATANLQGIAYLDNRSDEQSILDSIDL